MRRHLKSAKLDQPQSARRGIGRKQLVDAELGPMGIAGSIGKQVAEYPVDEPGGNFITALNLLERNFQFVQRVGPRLVDAGSGPYDLFHGEERWNRDFADYAALSVPEILPLPAVPGVPPDQALLVLRFKDSPR